MRRTARTVSPRPGLGPFPLPFCSHPARPRAVPVRRRRSYIVCETVKNARLFYRSKTPYKRLRPRLPLRGDGMRATMDIPLSVPRGYPAAVDQCLPTMRARCRRRSAVRIGQNDTEPGRLEARIPEQDPLPIAQRQARCQTHAPKIRKRQSAPADPWPARSLAGNRV